MRPLRLLQLPFPPTWGVGGSLQISAMTCTRRPRLAGHSHALSHWILAPSLGDRPSRHRHRISSKRKPTVRRLNGSSLSPGCKVLGCKVEPLNAPHLPRQAWRRLGNKHQPPTPLPPRPLGGARCAARPPGGQDLRARHHPSPASSRSPGGTGLGDLSLPRPAPHKTTRTGIKDSATLLGPGPQAHARPRSPGLAPHDLVLVRDELVYIFQVKLVRHGPSSSRRHNRSSRRRETSFLLPGSRVVSQGNRGDALRWRPRVKLASETVQAK